LVGRLFSNVSDSGSRTEIVLLITPRVVRNISALSAEQSTFELPGELQNPSSGSVSGQSSLRNIPTSQGQPPRLGQPAVNPTGPTTGTLPTRPIVPVVPTQPPGSNSSAK
jgi:general secretion pathway protein D